MIPIAKENRILAGRIATNAVLRDEPEPRDIVRTQARSVRISPSGRSDQTKITYKIKRGDTLGQIAEWFGVRAADIRNWNNIPYGRMIVAGTELTLWVNKSDAEKLRAVDGMTPAQKAALAKRSEQQSTDDVSSDVVSRYTVKPGDTLEKIAREHGVTIQQIRRWNNLSSTRLTVGKRLALYPRVKRVESLAANNPTGQKPKGGGGSRQIIYVVRKGDTISRIAQAHDVRESELREWNSLQRTNKIYTGQEIVIHKNSH
jgi:LysM repeat protein